MLTYKQNRNELGRGEHGSGGLGGVAVPDNAAAVSNLIALHAAAALGDAGVVLTLVAFAAAAAAASAAATAAAAAIAIGCDADAATR